MKTPIYVNRKEKLGRSARKYALARRNDDLTPFDFLYHAYQQGYRAALKDARKARKYKVIDYFLRPLQ